jgi:asparagine synthase (glutamine-hydrolysing)
MSGIFGVIGETNSSTIEKMGKRLAHRGTESSITEISSTVRLGCVYFLPNRGIIQLNQFSAVADYIIFDSKETTNPANISGQGRISDEDSLLAAYARSGADSLNITNGQFALAIWDSSKKELILARDYIGSVPLYYAHPTTGGIAFASEYKALLALDSIPAEPDLDMLQRLQHYKHLPSNKTLLKDIVSVPPGTVMAFSSDGQLKWSTKFPPLVLKIESISIDTASKTVSQAFLEAMKMQIAGLKTIGIALSGGIDSIGVAYACRQLNPDAELHTFTAGHGPTDPEMQTAKFVAQKIGAIHHEIVVAPQDVAKHLTSVVWHLENPIARTEALQFYNLGQEAGKYVDIVFTGAAADGLFAGMPKHKVLWLMHLLPLLRKPLAEFYILTQSGKKPTTLLGKLFDKIYFRGNVPAVPRIKGSNYKTEIPTFPKNSKEFVNEILCETFQEGVSQWLPKIEKTMRAAGVNYASPFLDRTLIDTAFSIPSTHKIYRGKEKYILRRALRDLMPLELSHIPKFPMKMKHDTTFSDTLDTIADQVLSKEQVEKRGFFDFSEIYKLRQRPAGQPYSSEGAMRIWTALVTEIWAQEFIDLRGERPAQLNIAN